MSGQEPLVETIDVALRRVASELSSPADAMVRSCAPSSAHAGRASSTTPFLDARLLIKHATGLDDAAMILRAHDRLSSDETKRLDTIVARRRAGEPIAYITGRREFWSLEFEVGDGVLVPRPDSETLVQAALDACPDRHGAYRILDLGVGSGCLLGALLHERPRAIGVGVDRNPVALALAKRNFDRIGIGARALCIASHWGAALGEPVPGRRHGWMGFDLIISNPPYIRRDDADSLAPDIRDYEDHGALFGGADGLAAYPDILRDAARLAASDGVVVLELGVGQDADVTALARQVFPQAQISLGNDLEGRIRAIVIKQ